MRERTGAQSGSELIAQAFAEGLIAPYAPPPSGTGGKPGSARRIGTSRIGLTASPVGSRDALFERNALVVAGCSQIFEEKIDGTETDRPGLAAAMDCMRTGDVLVVWKMSGLGASVEGVLTVACLLYKLGASVKILDGILAGEYAPHGEGKLFFIMAAALADLQPAPHGQAVIGWNWGHG